MSSEGSLGREHPTTLTMGHSLARLLHTCRKPTEAEALLRRVIVGRERSLGLEHIDTVHSVSRLAALLMAQRDLVAAVPQFRRALAGYEKLWGPAHRHTLLVAHDLGTALYAQGMTSEAESLFRRAVDGTKSSAGVSRTTSSRFLESLGSLLRLRGQLSQAAPLYLQLLVDEERRLGPTHVNTLASANNLAWMELEIRHPAEARSLFRRCVSAWSDRTDFQRLWPRLGLALCDVLETGDPAPAESVITELVTMLGLDHERVATARSRLAAALQRDAHDVPKDSP